MDRNVSLALYCIDAGSEEEQVRDKRWGPLDCTPLTQLPPSGSVTPAVTLLPLHTMQSKYLTLELSSW